jgi:hypothetical protein
MRKFVVGIVEAMTIALPAPAVADTGTLTPGGFAGCPGVSPGLAPPVPFATNSGQAQFAPGERALLVGQTIDAAKAEGTTFGFVQSNLENHDVCLHG